MPIVFLYLCEVSLLVALVLSYKVPVEYRICCSSKNKKDFEDDHLRYISRSRKLLNLNLDTCWKKDLDLGGVNRKHWKLIHPNEKVLKANTLN